MLQNQDTKSNDEIDLGRIFRLILLQSKFVFFISVIGLILGIGYLITSTKQYEVRTMLQVYSNSSNPFNSSAQGDLIFGTGGANDVELVANLYKTRTNILKIINKFNLNIVFSDDQYISFSEFNIFDESIKAADFSITLKETGYTLFDKQSMSAYELKYNESFSNEIFQINLKRPTEFQEDVIDFSYLQPSIFYPLYDSLLNIDIVKSNNFASSEGFINISLVTSKQEQGIDIINYANKLFLDTSIQFETEKARKAIEFIDDQLTSINDILEIKKSNLKIFKEENQSLNVDLEIKSIIESIAKLEESLNLIEVDLAEAAALYTSTNPIFKTINERKAVLVNQKAEIEDKIKSLPIAEQRYIDLFRDVEISQALYIDLANRKLGFSILEASTIGNIRVVDTAYVKSQVSPQAMSAILIAFLFFFAGIFIAIIRGFYFMPISNPAEINDAGINLKIYGVIPTKIEGDHDQALSFNRAIESCILNIESVDYSEDNKCKTVLFTSPTENNGKSLISREFSLRLAKMGKRTLLLDNDLIRGDQHKELNKNKISSSEFYDISAENIQSINLKDISDNLFFIPKISKLSDSFNFLYNDRYLNKLNELKKLFDYIIIDTAPALSVSDTSILITYADYNFIIARHNLSRISQIQQTYFLSEQIGKDFNGIIYNGYERPKSYYGYYGVYGDYRYQYYADRYLYSYKYKEKND